MKLDDVAGKRYAIYFDYTGAGRGPEPIAGPFRSYQEAENYAKENDIELGLDRFIEEYRG